MIKASALLVALAIGLLVAGVVGSSLLMVYVSIGVCAVAALLLAVGVASHWSEIFGRREVRPASEQGAWSEPQVHVTAPVLASIQAQAVAAARGSGRVGREEVGVRPDGARPGAARPGGPRPDAVRPGSGRAPERPAEVVPSPAEVAGRGDEFPAAGRNDDLWERVEEELGSAAKRDTGALSWPGTVFPPVPPDLPVSAESAARAPEAGAQGEPRPGASAWIWGSGAGWQPPETADPAWPPPAAAFAEPQTAPKPAAPEPAAPGPAAVAPAAPEPVAPGPDAAAPGAAGSGGSGDGAGPPVPDETAAEPASDAESAQDTDVAEGTEVAPDAEAAEDADVSADAGAVPADDTAPDEGVVPDAEASSAAEDHEAAEPAVESTPAEPATGDDGSRWIIATSRPAGQEPAAGTPAAQSPAAPEATAEKPAAGDSAVKEPAATAPGADDPGTDDRAAGEPAAKESAAQKSADKEPGPGVPEPAAEEPAGDGATARPATGRVEVTVVPGVARYHRSGCILIRFLGAGDLEIMTRQEAEDAKFAACRACQPDQLED